MDFGINIDAEQFRTKNMREFIRIVEAAQQSTGPHVSYYMEEGCGIFAVALSRALPGGQIGVLSRRNGEEWSDSIPYEVTHVFYWLNGKTYDVKGQRSLEAMASDFDIEGGDFDKKGPWTPKEFEREMMGDTDDAPLYGGSAEISQALRMIRRHPQFYGIAGATPPDAPVSKG